MITRIRLTNWKSHLNSELAFSKGVNALIGIMGSGKTSCMQGIAFALFGTFSALGSKKLAIDDLIMGKPHKKDSASVELDFAVNGKSYSVKRTLERGKGSSAEIREDGKLLEVNPQGVTREVERLLQTDYDLFQRAVYSEQNALDYFLQIPKGKRMQQIDEMLKLDRYEKAREAAVSIRNKLFERRKEMLRVIEDMKERRFDEKIAELGKEVRIKEHEKDEIKDKASEIEDKRRRLSEKVVAYEAQHDLLNEVARKSDVLHSRVTEMKKQIASRKLKLRGIKADQESLKAMAGEITRLEVRLEEKGHGIRITRDGVASKNGRIHGLREQIKEAKLRLSAGKENELKLKKLERLLGESPDKKLEDMLRQADDMKKKVYALEAGKMELQRSLSELEAAKDKCPVCEAPLANDRKKTLVEHRLKHIGVIDVKISEALKRLTRENAAVDELRRGVEQYADLRRELRDVASLEDSINENDDKVAMLLKEIKAAASDIRTKETEEKSLRKALEKAKLRHGRLADMLKDKEDTEKMIGDKNELEKHLKGLGKQKRSLERRLRGRDIKAMRNELQEVVGLSRGLEARLAALEETLRDKRTNLKDLEEQRELFVRYKKEISVYEKTTEKMDVFIAVLRSTQDQLRDEFLKNVNYNMNEVWEELYPYGDFTEIRILVEKDYVLQLKGSKGWLNAEMVSGGERSLACLALRIAFSLAFTPNLRWLILDEPTHNLDAKAIEHFGFVLRDKMENIVEQVFLITHEERLSDYITGPTYRLERDKEVDGVTKIVEL
jgi:exonuclease SbcC